MGAKVNINTKAGIESLQKVTNFNAQKKAVKKNPDVILYAAKYWSKNNENFKKLVFEALIRKPELILSFNNKDGLFINYEYVSMAVKAEPMIIAKMDNATRAFISDTLFIDAFARNPMVLSIPDLKVLNTRYKKVVENKNTKVQKTFHTTLRAECMRAIRLFEGVSAYRDDLDYFAVQIVDKIKQYKKQFTKNEFNPELANACETITNTLIKKNDQRVRVLSSQAWLSRKGRPAYSAIRKSAKENSDLEGLISNMPTDMFTNKMVKKLIISAVKVNPNYYLKLDEYGFGKFKNDATVKYNVYKALKRKNLLVKANDFMSQEDLNKAQKKLDGVNKREKTIKEQQANTLQN